MTTPDFHPDILDSINAPGDPHDFVGFALEHEHAYALVMLGLFAVRPDLGVENPRYSWDQTAQTDTMKQDVRELVDDFVQQREDELREKWLHENAPITMKFGRNQDD